MTIRKGFGIPVVLDEPIEIENDEGDPIAVDQFQPNATAATGTITASGVTTIVPSPGTGFFTQIHYYAWVCDPDSSNTPMVTLRSSGGTTYHLAPAAAKSWRWDVPPDEAVELVLSQTASGDGVGYTLLYTTETV